MTKDKSSPKSLINKLKDEGIFLQDHHSQTELRTEILKHISGGRNKTTPDGAHDRFFIKNAIVEIE